MGYLQTIKSPEAYVKKMRAFMSPMPVSERDEVCQEIRQHLEALLEDFQAEGRSPEEAIALAMKRFGSPVKVGREISRKWFKKYEQRSEAAKPPPLRRQERLLSIVDLTISCLLFWQVISVFYCHNLSPLLFWSAAFGLCSGGIEAYREALRERGWEAQGIDPRQNFQDLLPKLKQRLLQDQTWRGRLTFILFRLAGNRLVNTFGSFERKTDLKWNTWAIARGTGYFILLLLLPDRNEWLSYVRQLLVFSYVSGRATALSRILTNRLLLRGRTPQM